MTFTGSVETGRIVARTAGEKLIPVTLELGGKSPMIVMDDADLDKAVAGAVSGMRFTRQGQSCTAASRILVHEKVHDEFVAMLKARVDAMKMGDPLDEATDIGTIISRAQLDKVLGYIESGRAEPGATAHECSQLPDGRSAARRACSCRPVIFTGLDNASRLAREEIFGPVTCVIRFSSYEEAMALANDSDFGLAATIWTQRPEDGAGRHPAAAGRLRAGEPEHRRPARPVLRRRQAIGPRARGLAGGDAGPLHPQEDRDLQHDLSRLADKETTWL